MCGRYYIEPDDRLEELHALIAEAQRKAAIENEQLKTGEIFPSDIAPVIANGADMKQNVFPMRWGLPRPGSNGLVINARCETAAIKPMFRESAQIRRCLIPATNYYEWEKKDGKKIKYAIWPEELEMLYMGGLYILPANSHLAQFAILTRPASRSIDFIHDRMPVVVPKSKISAWLSPQISFDALMKDTLEDMAYKAV